MTCGAILIHGYHPGAEDAEIYMPGILKLLHPSLFPRNVEFFESHARMTLFPRIMAASIRMTHLGSDVTLAAWHILSIFLFLFACLRIARLFFGQGSAAWCGVALAASLLTLPVAGTALYLMDQYVTSRSLSAPAALFAAASALEGKRREAVVWLALTAAVHPLMALFAGSYAAIVMTQRVPRTTAYIALASAVPVPFLLPATLFPPVTPAYAVVLDAHPYFLLSNWAWYEWLGIFGPLPLLIWFSRLAEGRKWDSVRAACRALMVFEGTFFLLALIISFPGRFERFAEVQPMRALHLLYAILLVVGGGFLGSYVLKNRAWRWAALFVPLCATMFWVQRQLFPSSDHLELPGFAARNGWVRAFLWVRSNTPENAYFALDPGYAGIRGEDQHGFRVLARRSMLADAGKDSGAVSMFPAMADEWERQVAEQSEWNKFGVADFERLKEEEGVGWVVVQQPGIAGLPCPYTNESVKVCRVE